MSRHLLCVLLIAGCAGNGSYHGSATVYGSSPDLVYVSPGVQVIADYDEPVFYTNGYYWRYYGDTWYRSHTYTGGWRYASPPRALLRIDRPRAYVRYRPDGYVSRRPAYRDNRPVYRDNRPVIRDHRPPARTQRPPSRVDRDRPEHTVRRQQRGTIEDRRDRTRRDRSDDRRRADRPGRDDQDRDRPRPRPR